MALAWSESKTVHEVELRLSPTKRCFYECDIPVSGGRLGGFIIQLGKKVARVQLINDNDVILWQNGNDDEGINAFFAMNDDAEKEIAEATMNALIRASGEVQAGCATTREFMTLVGAQLEKTMSNMVLTDKESGKKWLNVNATGKLRLRIAFMDWLDGRHEALSGSALFKSMVVTECVVDSEGDVVKGLGRTVDE